MLEEFCFIASFVLLLFAIRMLVFLFVSWKEHLELRQMTVELSKTQEGRYNYNLASVTDNKKVILCYNSQLPLSTKTSSSKEFGTVDSAGIRRQNPGNKLYPVVSILVATNNEEEVIENLLKSLEMLTYSRQNFEIIIVDDSHDSTPDLLQNFAQKMEIVKIVRRNKRVGCKGSALNIALAHLRSESTWTIILDADSIVPSDMIEKFLVTLTGSVKDCKAIQGYCLPNNNIPASAEDTNWVSKGIELRLAHRNLVEFVARKQLLLPLQITGNLFMIKTSFLKEFGFSKDLCEDWDLTLKIFSDDNATDRPILFEENVNASNQACTSFSSYFRQRARVSEGHTRAFIKVMFKLARSKTQTIKSKVELFFTGFRYLKYNLIILLVLSDFFIVTTLDSKTIGPLLYISFSLQLVCVLSLLLTNILGVIICSTSRQYGLSFIWSKILLEICTIPALIFGSLLGILRQKGTFHKTRRNHVKKSYC